MGITEIHSHIFLTTFLLTNEVVKRDDFTKYFFGEGKFLAFPHCEAEASAGGTLRAVDKFWVKNQDSSKEKLLL